MKRKNANFLTVTEGLAKSFSILLLCVFCTTLLANSFSTLQEGAIKFELCDSQAEEGEQPINDCEGQKEENKEAVEEFTLINKSSILTAYRNKVNNPVPHKLLFESRINELFTPPPQL